jgi:thiamine monophosphate synthase
LKNLGIVWSAVVASGASALAVVLAIWGDPDVAMAFGAMAITSAILSIRETP